MKKEEKNGTFYKISENCEQIAIVKSKNEKFVIVCGEYQVSRKEFDTIVEAERFIDGVHYNEIFAMFYVLNKYYNESNKADKKEMPTND